MVTCTTGEVSLYYPYVHSVRVTFLGVYENILNFFWVYENLLEGYETFFNFLKKSSYPNPS